MDWNSHGKGDYAVWNSKGVGGGSATNLYYFTAVLQTSKFAMSTLCLYWSQSRTNINDMCIFLLSRQLFVVLCKYNIRTGLCDCKTNYKHLFTSKVLTSMSLFKLKIYLEFTKICLKMYQLYLKQVCDLAHCKIHKLSLSNLSTSKQHILKTIGCI